MLGSTAAEIDMSDAAIHKRWVDKVLSGDIPGCTMPRVTLVTYFQLSSHHDGLPEFVRGYQTVDTPEQAVELLLPRCRKGYVPPGELIGRDVPPYLQQETPNAHVQECAQAGSPADQGGRPAAEAGVQDLQPPAGG